MSVYLRSLQAPAKTRYLRKLNLLGLDDTDDPYCDATSSKFRDDMTLWPPVEFGNIFGYFVSRPGLYTQEQLLAWKQLDAYNYFQSGHVRTILAWRKKNVCLLKSLVNPSQKSPDDAHHCWVAVNGDGTVVSAHCTCMAGLGEACSHVAAVLFKVEYAVRNGYTAVTSQTCSWNQTFCKHVDPSPIAEIDFTKPKLHTPRHSNSATPQHVPQVVPAPTEDEITAFFDQLKCSHPKSAILSLVHVRPSPSTSSSQRPAPLPLKRLPSLLTSLYDPRNKKLSKSSLASASSEAFQSISLTDREADYLEYSTRLQAQCDLWFKHKKGRITASNFAAISRTRIDCPSVSLLKKVMQYTQTQTNRVPALKWGVDHEDQAREEYIELMKQHHEGFECHPAGLTVNPKYPHLGASPDGVVSCVCCGSGLLEIKCPYKHREEHPLEVVDPDFCLHRSDDEVVLKRNHDYFIQVQGQMAVCEEEYSDFVCWTTKGLHVERIEYSPSIFLQIKPSLDLFFKNTVLPELLTHALKDGNTDKEHQTDNQSDDILYCLCRKGESGRMIACDNASCSVEWFHYKCVGITRKPKGKWYCPNCQK